MQPRVGSDYGWSIFLWSARLGDTSAPLTLLRGSVKARGQGIANA